MSGTTPEGARNEQEAARWVRSMFGGIAHRYDLANHLLSANIDRYWRARTVRRVRPILERADARVLDICCGTADLALALSAHHAVLASDFCHPMLAIARQKIAERRAAAAVFESDALNLPVRDASLDLITVAFGFRNLASYEAGLAEMRRVLRPGGVALAVTNARDHVEALNELVADVLQDLFGGERRNVRAYLRFSATYSAGGESDEDRLMAETTERLKRLEFEFR